MDMLDRRSIQNLAKLLTPEEESSDSSDDDLPKTGVSKMGPADIRHVKVRVSGASGVESTPDAAGAGGDDDKKRDRKAIWQVDEVPEVPFSEDVSFDPRLKPEYDIKYRQSVTSQDIYLQLGPKTPATASCETMSLKVFLKGECHNDVDLQVSKQQIDVRSPQYRLGLPLPHPVHPDKCSAEWDSDSQTLLVTLYLDRELDFVNF